MSSAELGDSGNLVLRNSNGTIWSSFDHPTNTIIPSQNFTKDMVLRSGLYTFSLLSSGNLTLTWNDSIIYWNRGVDSSINANPWNNLAPGYNSSVNGNLSDPTLLLQQTGILSISDKSLSSPIIMAYSSDYAEENNADILRFLRLDDDGNLRIYSSTRGANATAIVRWAAVIDQCRVFGYCGNWGICSYDGSNPVCGCPSQNFEPVDVKDSRKGCKRKVEVSSCPGNETMLVLDHAVFLTYPPELSSPQQVFFAAISGCRGNCLTGAACDASTSVSDGTGLCYLKTTDFISGYQNPTIPSTSYVKVCPPLMSNPSPFPGAGGSRGTRLHGWIVVVVVIVTLFSLVAIEFVLWFWCFRKNPKFGGLSSQYTLLEYASGAPVQFSYKDLQQATKGFREKLGEGGFGAVYKGSLANRSVVAVKRLEGIEQGERHFRMEVATISSTHHLNLVRLIGFCSEGKHRLLVYEFMKNGSLDNILFLPEEQSREVLNWKQRFDVALGTAKAITYLHEECRDCIVHCDIKPENILLDENFNAKVSDFGLAKLINPKDHRHRTLTSVRGTRGYLAPEWLANLPINSKSDVYSYGMVLLEIVSGRRNFEVSNETSRKKFSVWAYEEFEKGNVKAIVDKRLVDQELNMEQALRAVQVSFWCMQELPSQRPTMGKVVQMLEGVMEITRPPPPKGAIWEGLMSRGSINFSNGGGASTPSTVSSLSMSFQTEVPRSTSARLSERVSSSPLESFPR